MKKVFLFTGAMAASTMLSQAAVVYSTDFSISYADGSGSFVFGGATPDVTTTEWFGSSNGVGVANDVLSFANDTQNRYRGSGVWLDTTGWATGLVTVQVDVTTFVAGADTTILFQAYSANGVDATDSVSLDLHGAATSGAGTGFTGGATIAELGTQQNITGTGTDVAFTFNFNGTDEYVGLTFVQENANDSTAFGSATLDNLSVETIPEPSAIALLGLGGVGFLLRRRRA